MGRLLPRLAWLLIYSPQRLKIEKASSGIKHELTLVSKTPTLAVIDFFFSHLAFHDFNRVPWYPR